MMTFHDDISKALYECFTKLKNFLKQYPRKLNQMHHPCTQLITPLSLSVLHISP